MSKKWYLWFCLLALLAFFSFRFCNINVSIKDDLNNKILSILASFLIISVFTERTTEVFLSARRSWGADVIDKDIFNLKEKIKNPANSDRKTSLEEELREKTLERMDYSNDSRKLAVKISLSIGFLIALTGITLFSELTDVIWKGDNKNYHYMYFKFIDCLFSACIFAAGSEFFNKIYKTFSSVLGQNNKQNKVLSD